MKNINAQVIAAYEKNFLHNPSIKVVFSLKRWYNNSGTNDLAEAPMSVRVHKLTPAKELGLAMAESIRKARNSEEFQRFKQTAIREAGVFFGDNPEALHDLCELLPKHFVKPHQMSTNVFIN
jgi:hypothetical protein